ncbi:hypothetical protein LP419_14585 [Massilia sp. H-1]|nr:hypothetical protein LP419_14585 [Massilia sp. H-1]
MRLREGLRILSENERPERHLFALAQHIEAQGVDLRFVHAAGADGGGQLRFRGGALPA